MSLWQGGTLVLASKSSARRAMLDAAGIPIVIDPANIDERATEAGATDAKAAAVLLARAKAAAVSKRRPNELVLGADQTLDLDGRRFSKPKSIAAAREQLAALAGRSHLLHSAAAVARGGEILFEAVTSASLTMRPLDGKFLDGYLAAVGDDTTTSVGAYRLEGAGVHLFEKIEGDHFTILGLPLLSLLAYFRGAGLVQ